MSFFDFLKTTKKKDLEISKRIDFSKDIDILKEELAHYPNHVISRALLHACEIILMLDKKNEFLVEDNKILDFNSPDIAKLANSFVTGIMNVYLENRVEIDAALGREVH